MSRRNILPMLVFTLALYDALNHCIFLLLFRVMLVSGTLLLDILTKEFGHDKIGLYRDYRLGCSQSLSVPESEKVKKKLWKSFRQSELSINVE